MKSTIHRTGNVIVVNGALGNFRLCLKLFSEIDRAVKTQQETQKFRDIVIDFAQCSYAPQASMLFLCAQVLDYRDKGIGFSFIVPGDKKLRDLFRNTNWGHYLDPEQFDPSTFRGYSHVPATQYTTESEQESAVHKIVKVILGAVRNLDRADFAAFEWSINEITDNVLVHSSSQIGGLVQVQKFNKAGQVQFVVADAGVGIPRTLRGGRPNLTSDTDALDQAIREGVTSDKKIGQGNGLFGSYQICSQGHGSFQIYSGYASLEFMPEKKKALRISPQKLFCRGTVVVATIDFSKPKLLEKALKFQGRKHVPVDFVETGYETSGDGNIHFHLAKESTSFGSRMAGKPIRTKLSNLYGMSGTGKISIDLNHIPVVSSSFADEVFGKLFLELGAVAFMQRFELVNTMDTVRQLIDKAITQRVSTGIAD